jgi:hypothetical protein
MIKKMRIKSKKKINEMKKQRKGNFFQENKYYI